MIDLDVEPIAAWPGVRQRLVVVAGPAFAETEEQVFSAASQIASPRISFFATRLWSRRGQPGSESGVGDRGLSWLTRVQRELALPVMTEIAEARQAALVLEHDIDAVWLGASTTGNPRAVRDISRALSGTSIPILIRNPTNPDVGPWISAVEQLNAGGQRLLAGVHRGFSALEQTRRTRATWELAVELQRRAPGLPLLCDASYVAKDKSELGSVAQLALDIGVHGLVFEAHPSPKRAWSGSAQQITPDRLAAILEQLEQRQTSTDDESFNTTLAELRQKIDRIDVQILAALQDRRGAVESVAELKREQNVAPLQMKRWQALLADRLERAEALGLNPANVREIYEAIHEESIRVQSNIMKKSR